MAVQMTHFDQEWPISLDRYHAHPHRDLLTGHIQGQSFSQAQSEVLDHHAERFV